MAAPRDLLVLSYNVSFEASSNWTRAKHPDAKEHPKRLPDGKMEKGYPTAWELGESCVETAGRGSITVCAQRQAKLIDSIPEAGRTFDFVGLQEASRSDKLQKASTALSAMTRIASSTHRAEMASFFDPGRYAVRYQNIDGEIAYARPCHVIVFDELQGSGTVLFLNVHNGHGSSYPDISRALSTSLAELNLSQADLHDLADARIVVTGDFNTDRSAAWSPLLQLARTTVSLTNPPMTCCTDPTGVTREGRPFRGGDFIFDSLAAAQPEVPANYPYTELLSDHLPVVARLDPMA